MNNKNHELSFQNNIITQLVANGWLLGKSENYNRQLALYSEDVLGFVQDTQDAQWRKFCGLYPNNPEQKFLEQVAKQLNKAEPNAANKELRTFGTLGVLRHELRDRGTRFSLCQFKPEHELNPDTLLRYKKNRLRVVPELVYSPWLTAENLAESENKAKAWRIDLVLFVNGLPVATLELKSEFKQSVDNAVKQYKTTRFSIDPKTKKSEPLLTFKLGALVHFAVSQYEVYMTTHLEHTNVSYLAFTATPKSKTVELFGRLPNPNEPPSKTNLPKAFHVYSMRQAIEEGFILDVLKNYTNYKVAYNLAMKINGNDQQVESKKAKVKINQWVRLHDYNISQKVQVIIEHFKNNVLGLLNSQAKAMVVTGSRKEAVRYKTAFDEYIKEKGYQKIYAMVAFSGEVEFSEKDPNATALLGEKFTEINMNPDLKGRDLRKAFDSDHYQVMIVANKFQTGFDQPKLCAMYVDKKLGGVDCVQTLSRLNRIYPGKVEIFILDFINEPEDILKAFKPYYQTAELANVSDPDLIFNLYDKLRSAGIFTWPEVEQFWDAFYVKNKSDAAIANICKPTVVLWQNTYKTAVEAYKHAKEIFDRTKSSNDAVLIANAEKSLKERKQEIIEAHDTSANEYKLVPGNGAGTAKPRNKKEEFLSEIIFRLNALFITDHLTKNDMVNYAYTIRDKVRENERVMKQLANNPDEQAILGDFSKAVDDAIFDSKEAHQNQVMQLLSDPKKVASFAKVVFDLLKLAE